MITLPKGLKSSSLAVAYLSPSLFKMHEESLFWWLVGAFSADWCMCLSESVVRKIQTNLNQQATALRLFETTCVWLIYRWFAKYKSQVHLGEGRCQKDCHTFQTIKQKNNKRRLPWRVDLIQTYWNKIKNKINLCLVKK